jgi:hypothetical protein
MLAGLYIYTGIRFQRVSGKKSGIESSIGKYNLYATEIIGKALAFTTKI